MRIGATNCVMLGLVVLGIAGLVYMGPRPAADNEHRPDTLVPAETPPLQESSSEPQGVEQAEPQVEQRQAGTDALASAEEERNAFIERRVVELQELSRRSNALSLKILLEEVRNSEKEIRRAALDALAQSGNRSAIPALAQLAQEAEEPEEKQAIEETIEFLQTPTLTELLKQQRSTDGVTN